MFRYKKEPQPFSGFAYRQCKPWNTKKLCFLRVLMLSGKKICIFSLVGSASLQVRAAQPDRWIAALYQKHFDLGKTRCATTDNVTWKATVDVCNRIHYAAHDWHNLVDKLAIFVQRWYTFFCSAKCLFFQGCKIFVAGLVYVVSI